MGLGAELAWVAAMGAPVPLFPIGGIDGSNIDQLSPVGRAAVGSALLAAQDPDGTATYMRRTLEADAGL